MSQETIVNKEQFQKALEALTELIDAWNDLGHEHESGHLNNALCLLLWDDGSGRLGTVFGRPETFNEQTEFDSPAGLVDYLADWLKYDETKIADLLNLSDRHHLELMAEIERLRGIIDEADERAKIIEERLDNVITGNGLLIAELEEWRTGARRIGEE